MVVFREFPPSPYVSLMVSRYKDLISELLAKDFRVLLMKTGPDFCREDV
jgi:hypothetical protein